MIIDLYATAQANGPKDNRQTACALVMVATDTAKRVQVRRQAFPLGASTINLASIQAIRLALMALRPWVLTKQVPVNLYTDSYYAIGMLAKVGANYKADPKFNIAAVTSMRGWSDKIHKLILIPDKFVAGIGYECVLLARNAAVAQTMVDGGTREFINVAEAGLQTST